MTHELVDHARFIELLTDHFPAVAADIDEYRRGLLHPEMAVLAWHTKQAIKARDWTLVRALYEFADSVYRQADADVENAVYLSFMDLLPIWGDEPEARALLPNGLREVLRNMEG